MNNFTYWAPTRYEFGRGAEEKAGQMASFFGMTRVLLVYGQGSAVRSGVLDRVERALSDAGIACFHHGGIAPNPTDADVYKGLELVKEHGVDAVIAVGGGSPIDAAKAIAAGACYDGDFWDFWAGRATVQNALPIGVVLTIPAAGSEGSGNSVITKLDTLAKISLRTDYWLRPRFALLNPELTFTLPPYQTAAGIVDMMAHIFERYYSPSHDVDVTDRVSEGLLRAIIDCAPRVLADPCCYEARANIMWAGTLAHNGVCGCGRTEDWSSHFMEHELSALYGVTHGAGLAVVNSAYMEFMAHHRPARVAQMARRVFDVTEPNDTEAALKGVACLRAFYTSIGMPVTLAELGVPNADIPEMVRRVHINKGNPFGAYYPITPAESTAIYNLMLG